MAVEKKNIFLSDTAEYLPYSSPSRFSKANIPIRLDHTSHGNYLKREFEKYMSKTKY